MRFRLEAIRDERLRPLVDRIGSLERENGRLEAELDQAVRGHDALRDEAERLRAVPAPLDETDVDDEPRPATDALMLRWRRWFRRMTEGRH